MKTVFSGVQPSGELHLGNYLGAIRNWVTLQEQYRCIFCVVDYHAITQPFEPKEMARRVQDAVIDIVACGVDPAKSVLFLQSMVPEHTELCWVLNTVAHHGDLERMTQFKDKSEHQPESINVALFDYPVLQAADILLYKGELVPVGQDQDQHLELARRIARSFNHNYGATFPEPGSLHTKVLKLPGLDGSPKMSKSQPKSVLPLKVTGDEKALWNVLRHAVPDPARADIKNPGNPDICNVFTMHKELSPEIDQAWAREGCTTASIGCGDCKKKLAANIHAHFAGYAERRKELVAHPEQVAEILALGARKAREIAVRTMAEVREKLGLWRSP